MIFLSDPVLIILKAKRVFSSTLTNDFQHWRQGLVKQIDKLSFKLLQNSLRDGEFFHGLHIETFKLFILYHRMHSNKTQRGNNVFLGSGSCGSQIWLRIFYLPWKHLKEWSPFPEGEAAESPGKGQRQSMLSVCRPAGSAISSWWSGQEWLDLT